MRGWEAGAEAEPPFQTAAEAPRRGWAPGHGLRREQVETWPGSSPLGSRSGRSSAPGLHRPRRAAPRRRLPSGLRVRDASRPRSPQGARPRDSISKACGISCLSLAGGGRAGRFPRAGKGWSPVPRQLRLSSGANGLALWTPLAPAWCCGTSASVLLVPALSCFPGPVSSQEGGKNSSRLLLLGTGNCGRRLGYEKLCGPGERREMERNRRLGSRKWAWE